MPNNLFGLIETTKVASAGKGTNSGKVAFSDKGELYAYAAACQRKYPTFAPRLDVMSQSAVAWDLATSVPSTATITAFDGRKASVWFSNCKPVPVGDITDDDRKEGQRIYEAISAARRKAAELEAASLSA